MNKPESNNNSMFNLIVILGPTATGKTKFASVLADRIGGEIISADSRQVYRRMNIGTGKDYDDYLVDGNKVPYHMIDICEPGEKYNVFEFQKDFSHVYYDITNRNKFPILCGGTGLYIEAVTKSYRLVPVPENDELRKKLENLTLKELEEILTTYRRLHNQTDTDTISRAIRAIEIEEYYKNHPEIHLHIPELVPFYIGLQSERFVRRKMITERLLSRLNHGLVDEVSKLLNEGIKPEDLIYYGLEYKYITLFLLGKLDYQTMTDRLNTAIHQFAKRQMTWFRKMEREGIQLHWIDSTLPMPEKLRLALQYLLIKPVNKEG